MNEARSRCSSGRERVDIITDNDSINLFVNKQNRKNRYMNGVLIA